MTPDRWREIEQLYHGASERAPGLHDSGIVLYAADVNPSPAARVYAFSRETTQRNLYRIPIP